MALTVARTSLRWAVKESFVRYVATSGGRVSCGNGAQWMAGEFDFAADEVSSHGESRAFLGDVLFVAHGSLLRVALGLPRIDIVGEAAAVSALTDPADPTTRIEIARAVRGSAPEDADGRTAWDASLTAEGARIFGGNYPPGAELAPLRF